MTMAGLWVDDSEQFLIDNIPRLERQGLQIDSVTSADAALEALRENPLRYAYVVVDLEMPEIDGIELYRRIRAMNPDIQILISSAHIDEQLWAAPLTTLGEELKQIPKDFPMDQSSRFKTDIIEKLKAAAVIGATWLAFHYPLGELALRNEAERRYLREIAREISAPHVGLLFEAHKEVGHVVVGGGPDQFLKTRLEGEPPPSSEELEALSQEHGVPVFSFSRSEVLMMTDAQEVLLTEVTHIAPGMVSSPMMEDGVFSAEIPALYAQIRELLVRSNQEPELRAQLDETVSRLRSLQVAEADELERRFEARLNLRPGSGWEHLKRMRERLGDA